MNLYDQHYSSNVERAFATAIAVYYGIVDNLPKPEPDADDEPVRGR